MDAVCLSRIVRQESRGGSVRRDVGIQAVKRRGRLDGCGEDGRGLERFCLRNRRHGGQRSCYVCRGWGRLAAVRDVPVVVGVAVDATVAGSDYATGLAFAVVGAVLGTGGGVADVEGGPATGAAEVEGRTTAAPSPAPVGSDEVAVTAGLAASGSAKGGAGVLDAGGEDSACVVGSGDDCDILDGGSGVEDVVGGISGGTKSPIRWFSRGCG